MNCLFFNFLIKRGSTSNTRPTPNNTRILCKIYLAFFYVLLFISSLKCNLIEKKRIVLEPVGTTKLQEPSFKSVFGISSKRGKGQLPQIASSRINANGKHVVSLYSLFITKMLCFLVKAIVCVKDMIKLKR